MKITARCSLFSFGFLFWFEKYVPYETIIEKEMATHSSILAWRIPRTEESDGLPSMGLRRVGNDWVTKHTECMKQSSTKLKVILLKMRLLDSKLAYMGQMWTANVRVNSLITRNLNGHTWNRTGPPVFFLTRLGRFKVY